MENFDKSFEELFWPNKPEESIKEFSNWIMGIAFANCAFLISESNRITDCHCNSHKALFIFILILAMLGALISGFNKFLILKRDIFLSIKQQIFKAILVDYKLNKIPQNEAINQWEALRKEFNSKFKKIEIIGLILNISILLTTASIIMTAIYILLTL